MSFPLDNASQVCGWMVPLDVWKRDIFPRIVDVKALSDTAKVCRNFNKSIDPILRVMRYFWTICPTIRTVPVCIWASTPSALAQFTVEPRERIQNDDLLVQCEELMRVASIVRKGLIHIAPTALETAKVASQNDSPPIRTASQRIFQALVDTDFEEAFDAAVMASYQTNPRNTALLCSLIQRKTPLALENATEHGGMDELLELMKVGHAPAFERAKDHALQGITFGGSYIKLLKRLVKANYKPAFEEGLRTAEATFEELRGSQGFIFEALCSVKEAQNRAFELASRSLPVDASRRWSEPSMIALLHLTELGHIPSMKVMLQFAIENSDSADEYLYMLSLSLLATLVRQEYEPALRVAPAIVLDNLKKEKWGLGHLNILFNELFKIAHSTTIDMISQFILDNLEHQDETKRTIAYIMLKRLCQYECSQHYPKFLEAAERCMTKDDKSMVVHGLSICKILVAAKYAPAYAKATDFSLHHAKSDDKKISKQALKILKALVRVDYDKIYDSALAIALENLHHKNEHIQVIARDILTALISNNHTPTLRAAGTWATQNTTHEDILMPIRIFEALVEQSYSEIYPAATRAALELFVNNEEYSGYALPLFEVLVKAKYAEAYPEATKVALQFLHSGFYPRKILKLLFKNNYTPALEALRDFSSKHGCDQKLCSSISLSTSLNQPAVELLMPLVESDDKNGLDFCNQLLLDKGVNSTTLPLARKIFIKNPDHLPLLHEILDSWD